MPPLANQRQERFCLGAVQGISDRESYELAGYSPNNAKGNACRLRKIREVSDRIMELQSEISRETIASVIERKERLTTFIREELPTTSIQAIRELNAMERIYSEGEEVKDLPPIINVQVVSVGDQDLTQRILSGERTG